MSMLMVVTRQAAVIPAEQPAPVAEPMPAEGFALADVPGDFTGCKAETTAPVRTRKPECAKPGCRRAKGHDGPHTPKRR